MRLLCTPFVVVVCSLLNSAAVDGFVVPVILNAQTMTPSPTLGDTTVMTMTDHKIAHQYGATRLCLAATAATDGTNESTMQPPAIECYLVTDEAVLGEGVPPKVVCTSEPEDYAWFNGIDPAKLLKTDTVSELATECVEGASPRGIPEWECK